MTTRWLQTHIAKRPSQFSIDRVFYNPIDRCSGETRCSGLCLVLGCLAAVFSSEKKEQRVLNGFDHFVESTNQFWWLKEPYAHGRIQEVDHCGDAGFHRCKSQLDIYIYDMAIWLWPRIGRDSPIFSHVFPPTNGLGAEKAKVRGQSLPGPRSVSPKGLRIHRFSSTFDDPRVRSEGR